MPETDEPGQRVSPFLRGASVPSLISSHRTSCLVPGSRATRDIQRLTSQFQQHSTKHPHISHLHYSIMDIANQLFSLTLGVEPNKQTLQNIASTMNSAGTKPKEPHLHPPHKTNASHLQSSPLPTNKKLLSNTPTQSKHRNSSRKPRFQTTSRNSPNHKSNTSKPHPLRRPPKRVKPRSYEIQWCGRLQRSR